MLLVLVLEVVFVEGRESLYELSSSDSDDTSDGVVIAIVIAVMAVCLMLGVLAFLLARKRQSADRSTHPMQVTPITYAKSTRAATKDDSNQLPVAVAL